MTESKNPVQSVQRALDIVDIVRGTDGIRISEIVDRVDLTKGAVHCHLATLEANGYVVKDGNEYRLGLQFLDLAHDAQNQVEIYDVAKAEVDELAERSGEMALFTVEENGEGVCLHKVEGENSVRTEVHVGYRNELYHTAVGKAMLAFMVPEKRDRIIENTEFEAITPNTITGEQRLRRELEEIRETGIAYNREETIQGLVGVGTPVRDQEGTVYGAVSVIGPGRRMDSERLTGEIAEMIQRAVNIIEINITSLRVGTKR